MVDKKNKNHDLTKSANGKNHTTIQEVNKTQKGKGVKPVTGKVQAKEPEKEPEKK